jgi:hypothetical protein
LAGDGDGLGFLVRDALEVAQLPVQCPVIAVATRRLPHAYRIYTRDHPHHCERIEEWLGALGIGELGTAGNVFTSAFKDVDPNPQFWTTAKLDGFLEAASTRASEPRDVAGGKEPTVWSKSAGRSFERRLQASVAGHC